MPLTLKITVYLRSWRWVNANMTATFVVRLCWGIFMRNFRTHLRKYGNPPQHQSPHSSACFSSCFHENIQTTGIRRYVRKDVSFYECVCKRMYLMYMYNMLIDNLKTLNLPLLLFVYWSTLINQWSHFVGRMRIHRIQYMTHIRSQLVAPVVVSTSHKLRGIPWVWR